VSVKPEHFKIASQFFFEHVKAFHETTQRLLVKAEAKLDKPAPVITQEDARSTALGLLARSESPNNVAALKKALASSEKIVADAQSIQFDLSTRNAELQMKNMELENKVVLLNKNLESMSLALTEMQDKLVQVQMAQLAGL